MPGGLRHGEVFGLTLRFLESNRLLEANGVPGGGSRELRHLSGPQLAVPMLPPCSGRFEGVLPATFRHPDLRLGGGDPCSGLSTPRDRWIVEDFLHDPISSVRLAPEGEPPSRFAFKPPSIEGCRLRKL